MLGKLIKHEFHAVSKILGILHIALFFTTIMGIIAINANKNKNFEFFSNITLVLYIIILLGVAVSVMIYLVVRFYRNLFTDEGYLMNTLPVKPYQLILSKVFVSFVWSIINGICTIFSIFMLILSQTTLDTILAAYREIELIFLSEAGMSFGSLFFLLILGTIISVFNMFLMFFASIAMGQTMKSHKVLFSLGAYIVLYIVSQVISAICLVPFGFASVLQADTLDYGNAFMLYLFITYLVSILLTAAYFIITNYIVSKKLNLE